MLAEIFATISITVICCFVAFLLFEARKWDKADSKISTKSKSKFERVLDLVRAGEIIVKIENNGNNRWLHLFDKSKTHLLGFRTDDGIWPHHKRDSSWSCGNEFLGLDEVTGAHLAKIYAASLPTVEDLEASLRSRIEKEVRSEFQEQLADFDRRLNEVSK